MALTAKARKAERTPFVRRVGSEEPDLPAAVVETGTRRRVLLAALGLFARRGFHGTSIRDIGEAAGVRSATLYEYFPSKEHLLARLMVIGHEALLAAIRAAVLGAGATPPAQVRAYVRAHVKGHCDYAMLAVVINNELHALSPQHAQAALVLRHQAELLALEIVERGVREGAWDPPNPLAAIAAIGSMGIRAAHWFEPSAGFGSDDLAEHYADLALHMLAMRGRSENE